MRLRLGSFVERVRSSLFLVPMIGVIVAIVLATAAIGFDQRLDESGADLPLGLTSTVESARALLSTVAGATITFAGIAFSVSLLIIQQASNQYSPRVVHTLFRDPFNRRVMALVVGTFTYCLLVLRTVRTALEEGGDPVIPNLSVAIAVALGIITILAIVAFIDHSAHSMDVSRILKDVEHEAIAQIRREWSVAQDPTEELPSDRPDRDGHAVAFDENGWIQQIDVDRLLACVPAGETMWVEASPGRYAIAGTSLCTLSVAPDQPDIERAITSAVKVGDTRTMQQDMSFGVRQLADVALKALSPGINDPTTAQDAIFHGTAVLAELLRRDPPSPERTAANGARVVLAQQITHSELIGLAFDEVRQAAASQPTVCIYLLESLALLRESLAEAGLEQRDAALLDQAALVVAGCRASDQLPVDIEAVEAAFTKRFGDGSGRPVSERGSIGVRGRSG